MEGAPLETFTPKILPPYRAAQKAGAVKTYPQSLSYSNDIITACFEGIGDAKVKVEMYPDFVIFRVLSCPRSIERLYFGGIYCPECGQGYSSVGMALNMHTNSDDILSINSTLGAVAFRDFGMEGAAFAAVFCREDSIGEVMRKVTCEYTEDIPWSVKGGAFANDHQDIRNSYLMNLSGVTTDTVDSWIKVIKQFGASQVDFHGGFSFRFGDFEPNQNLYPEGRKDLAKVISRFHQAGIQVGLHTYAQFIAWDSRYVTPVPHPDLGGYLFTLATSVGTEDKIIPVVESTADISTKTGFFVRNSVLLMIDQEIMKFDAVGENEFVICERGALGTTPAHHAAGTPMKHLFSVFGLLAADPDSDLYLEIARNTADMYNELGFDMIYLDAIDGSDVFAGSDKAWYHSARFVAEILRNVKKPPILEMSEMWHHFWYFRSRMGAWDHSSRGHKSLLGEHNRSNLRVRNKTLLPQNYGWWGYGKPDPEMPIQVRRQFIDDYEFWAGNALKNDWSLSFIPKNEGSPEQILNDEMGRFADVIHEFEKLRLSGEWISKCTFDDREIMFCDGKLIPTTYQTLRIVSEKEKQAAIVPQGECLRRLRIENRPCPVKNENGPVLFSAEYASEIRMLASQNVQAVMDVCDGDVPGMRLTAIQKGDIGYARMERLFTEKMDITAMQGLYIMVYGDGKGQVLDIQIKGQKYSASGTLDRVIDIDFVGWKCFKLIESDAHRLEENYWPFSLGGHYNEPNYDPVFKIAEDVEFSQYEWHPSSMDVDIYLTNRQHAKLDDLYSVSVWMNNMKDGETYSVTVGEISTFPIQRQALNELCIQIDGKEYPVRGQLPVESYIEYDNGKWYGYDVDGNLLKGIIYPELPDDIPAGSMITVEAEGEYGLELTIGTSDSCAREAGGLNFVK